MTCHLHGYISYKLMLMIQKICFEVNLAIHFEG